jgi:hypothetical protein
MFGSVLIKKRKRKNEEQKRHTVPDRTAWLIPATIRVVAKEIFLTACSRFILNYPHATIQILLPGLLKVSSLW